MIEGDQVAQEEYPDGVDDDQEELQALRMQKNIEPTFGDGIGKWREDALLAG